MRSEYLRLPNKHVQRRKAENATCQLTFELEGEVVSQVPAFVIPSKQEEGVRIPYLECPQVEDALIGLSARRSTSETRGASPRC